MKKALLAVLLLALVLAVSYLKTYRDEQKRSRAFKEIRKQTSRELGVLGRSVDSLMKVVNESRIAFEDSIRESSQIHASETDSLT